jgi:chemotaxis protein CheX
VPAATLVPARTVPAHAVETLHGVATHVFASMVGQPIVPIDPNDAAPPGPAQIVGTVAFTGSWTGYLAVVTSRAAATAITGALLGADAEVLEAQVRDALGEVVNVVAGGFRSRMSKPGDAWAVTIPMVATGDGLAIAHPRDAGRLVQRFRFGAHLIEVHLVVTSMADPAR